MTILKTEQEKKSFGITALLFAILLLGLFYLRFAKSLDVPELEGGGGGGDIAINFGDSDVGSGTNYESMESVRPAAKSTPVKADEEEIISQENEDAPVIQQVVKRDKPKVETKPVVKEPVKPQASKSTNDALASILNSSSKGGDGDDGISGNKGKANGEANARGYNGGGGSGTGSGGGNGSGEGLGTGSGYGNGNGAGRGNGNGNYQLAGRKFLSTPQPNYTCNEQGTVVVQISVDKNGKVTNAEPGVRGSTNLAKCLLDQAKIAAMNTKVNPSADAPDKQVGKIIYNFKLTE